MTPSTDSIEHQKAALIVAHPGHELRVHRWLETARPVTFVLTKGDGHTGMPRIASTTKVLAAAEAEIGKIYGRFKDAELYAALLRRDHAIFLDLLDELVDEMIARGITYAAADAEEGYNPAHDVCRHLSAAATAMVTWATRRRVRDFDFTLIAAPDACPEHLRPASIWLELDDDALARKLKSAQNYPGLQSEVARALDSYGAAAFRVECLRPAIPKVDLASPAFYEEYGQHQVATGRYAEVVTYANHVLPLRNELWTHAGVAT